MTVDAGVRKSIANATPPETSTSACPVVPFVARATARWMLTPSGPSTSNWRPAMRPAGASSVTATEAWKWPEAGALRTICAWPHPPLWPAAGHGRATRSTIRRRSKRAWRPALLTAYAQEGGLGARASSWERELSWEREHLARTGAPAPATTYLLPRVWASNVRAV